MLVAWENLRTSYIDGEIMHYSEIIRSNRLNVSNLIIRDRVLSLSNSILTENEIYHYYDIKEPMFVRSASKEIVRFVKTGCKTKFHHERVVKEGGIKKERKERSESAEKRTKALVKRSRHLWHLYPSNSLSLRKGRELRGRGTSTSWISWRCKTRRFSRI